MVGAATALLRDTADLRKAQPRDASFDLDGAHHRAAIYGAGDRRPGVLLLHTALGLTLHDSAMAHRLERAGFTAMTVRYSPMTNGRIVTDAEACRRIDRICHAAFERLSADPSVLDGRVSILGLSLGAHFAIRLAATVGRPGVAAVAAWYGVYPETLEAVRRLASPLLIVQGDLDAALLVDSARTAASENPGLAELHVCTGGTHQFDMFQPRAPMTQAAWQRTTAFLMGERA